MITYQMQQYTPISLSTVDLLLRFGGTSDRLALDLLVLQGRLRSLQRKLASIATLIFLDAPYVLPLWYKPSTGTPPSEPESLTQQQQDTSSPVPATLSSLPTGLPKPKRAWLLSEDLLQAQPELLALFAGAPQPQESAAQFAQALPEHHPLASGLPLPQACLQQQQHQQGQDEGLRALSQAALGPTQEPLLLQHTDKRCEQQQRLQAPSSFHAAHAPCQPATQQGSQQTGHAYEQGLQQHQHQLLQQQQEHPNPGLQELPQQDQGIQQHHQQSQQQQQNQQLLLLQPQQQQIQQHEAPESRSAVWLPAPSHVTTQEQYTTQACGWQASWDVIQAVLAGRSQVGLQEARQGQQSARQRGAREQQECTQQPEPPQQLRIDGVLGFSQGAAVAAVVAALCQQQQTAEHTSGSNSGCVPECGGTKLCQASGDLLPQLKFVILASGFVSPAPEHQELLRQQAPINLPSLHVYASVAKGGADRQIQQLKSEELLQLFAEESRQVITHSGGHMLPSDAASVAEVKSFLQQFV